MQFVYVIFYIFAAPFKFSTCKSITSLFVTCSIFSRHPSIKCPQDLHSNAFARVLLPQMPHRTFLLNSFLLIFPILHTVTFVFARLTFWLYSQTHFSNYKMYMHFSHPPPIKTISTTYNIVS